MNRRGRAVWISIIVVISAGAGLLAADLASPPAVPKGWHDSGGGGGVDLIACATPTWCAGIQPVGAKDVALIWNGHSWSSESIPPFENYVALSCPAADGCIGLTSNGEMLRLTQKTWRLDGRYHPAAIGPASASPSAALSCTSISSCVAVNGAGDEVTLSPEGWGKPIHIDDTALTGISCPEPGSCVAIDGEGRVLTSHRGRFGMPRVVAPDALQAIACPSDGFCAIADLDGRVRVGAPGRFGSPHALAAATEQPVALACPATNVCVAAGPDGAISLMTDGRWMEVSKTPAVFDGSSIAEDVSCPPDSGGFCAVSDQLGDVEVGDAPFDG